NNTNVFAFGIGSAVNRFLIEGVARAGMGEPFIVSDESEAAAMAVKFRSYIDSPVLTDIHVRASGFDVYDMQPAHFPDIFAQRPIILFGKWRGDISGTFQLTGKTGQGDFSTVLDVAGIQPDESNLALRYLWARSKISELSDLGDDTPSDERINAITSLGLEYN